MRICRHLCGTWACSALLLACALWPGRTAQAERLVRLSAAVSPRTATAHWLRRAKPDDVLPMSITLGLRHADELEALIAGQHDPQSPLYRRWLTPAQFAARFSPPADEYGVTVSWLEGRGFRVQPTANRLRIDFTGTVADVERAFGVHMHQYAHHGRLCMANADEPSLPAEVADKITVLRLNTFPLAEPLVRVTVSGVTVNAMAPRDIYTAYHVQPVLDRHLDGSGQTIAVAARADFNDSDVTDFQLRFGVPLRGPLKIFPGGNPGIGAVKGVCASIRNPSEKSDCIRGEEGEVLLDVEWAGAMGPQATVLVDISDTDIDKALLDIVNNHPEAKVISISFGACERLANAEVQMFRPLYAQAAVQGQSVLVATGDNGSDDCQDGGAPGVNALATDVNVTAVGGTSLDPGFDVFGNATGYVSESVWNDSGSTGGGVSILVAKPSYQSGAGVPTDGFRDVPDIALLGSPSQSGYAVVIRGAIDVVGGTSVSAPSWAGIVSLLNQAVKTNGMGGLNPILYHLGRWQYDTAGPAVFHDVTVGTNAFNGVRGFAAGTGFDLASGLGTPDVDRLTCVLQASACAGDCNQDGVVTTDELLLGAQILLGARPTSACTVFDVNCDGRVTVDEVIAATNQARAACR